MFDSNICGFVDVSKDFYWSVYFWSKSCYKFGRQEKALMASDKWYRVQLMRSGTQGLKTSGLKIKSTIP